MDDRHDPRPVRRLPARVYWVRRLVVLGLPLLLVGILVGWLVGRGGGTPVATGSPTSTPTGSAPATPTDAGTTDAPDGGVEDCADPALTVAIEPTAAAFGAGEEPTFEVTLTNTGADPCLVDAGEAARTIVVTSGDDRVWSNRDCLGEDVPERTLLLTGDQSDVTTFTWTRVRSAEGCPDGLPEPGAGSYAIGLEVQDVEAPGATFGLG